MTKPANRKSLFISGIRKEFETERCVPRGGRRMRCLRRSLRKRIRPEDPDDISPTEREFDLATAEGKFRLIFVNGMALLSDHDKKHLKLRICF